MLSYFFSIFTVIYIIIITIQIFRISTVFNAGKDARAEILKNMKVKNDNIKLYLKTAECDFTCSLRRSKKNKNMLDYEFSEAYLVSRHPVPGKIGMEL